VAWLRLAKAPKNAACVWFNIEAEECARRVAGRRGHPTIEYEGENLGYGLAKTKASMIVRSFAKKMQPPTKGEGFSHIYTVTSIAEANDLLRTWGWDESWPARKRQLAAAAATAVAAAAAVVAATTALTTPVSTSTVSTTIPSTASTSSNSNTTPSERAKSPSTARSSSPAATRNAAVESKSPVARASTPTTPTASDSAATVAVAATTTNDGKDGKEDAFIAKFPRTHHLFDTGGSAVSSDDLVLATGDELGTWFGPDARELVVQEKIDGANLGISLTADYQVLCQNRSHYVNSSSHSQVGSFVRPLPHS
jgi:hypothetical protein